MSKPLWILLLVCTGAFALWRGAIAGKAFWTEQRLSYELPAQVTEIEVIPRGTKYALRVCYTYHFRKHAYNKDTFLKKPYYLNKASAERAAKAYEGMKWSTWVDPKKPSRSCLEKNFPYLEIVYAVVALGIFLYFVYLRVHLALLSRIA